MRLIFHIALLLIYISISNSSLYSNVKDSISTQLKGSVKNLLQKSLRNGEPDSSRFQIKHNSHSEYEPKLPKISNNIKNGPVLRHGHEPVNAIPKVNRMKKIDHYRMDPVLNFFRRSGGNARWSFSSDSSSSSMELKDWKDEWKEHWIHKKIEAINSTAQPRGDVVNMVAARPWGVPCGDPDQHDMPWGTCMLAMECDAEYRIFRGDYFCGRSQFICCAIQLTNYDMYQGFDVSFADSALSTSSEEKRNRGKGSKERNRRKRRRAREKRRRERLKRKKKIKKNIRKIIREMRKILNRSYRNGTSDRKKRTKQLKKFIRDLKKKYRTDRKMVSAIHENDMIKIDEALMKRLNQIKGVNQDFVRNSTFRDIVINGTINKQGARMLVQAYPELASSFMDGTRRSNSIPKDYTDYDLEYGLLYY